MFLFFIVSPMLAEQSKIDSLKSSIPKTEESIIADLYLEISAAYFQIAPDSGICYASKVLDIEKSFVNNEQLAKAYYYIAFCYKSLQDWSRANHNFNRSYNLYNEIQDSTMMAYILKNIGIVQNYLGNSDSALLVFNEALLINETIHAEREKAQVLGNLGMIYRNMSSYDNAVDCFTRALEYFAQEGELKYTANTYNHLGNIYRDWNKDSLALSYYNKAYNIFDSIGDKRLKASVINNIGIIYRTRGQYIESIAMQKEALALKAELGNKKGMAASFLGIGISYAQLKLPDSALVYYSRAAEVQKSTGDKIGLGATLGNMAQVYFDKREYSRAKKLLNESNLLAKESHYTELLKNNFRTLSEICEKQGQYEAALEANKKFHQIKDSIYTETTHKQIVEVEAKYQNEKKQTEIHRLNYENKLHEMEIQQQTKTINEKNIQIYFLIFFVLLMLTSTGIIHFQLRKKREAYTDLVKKNIEIDQLKEKKIEAKESNGIGDARKIELIQKLKQLIRTEPHFFFDAETNLPLLADKLESNTSYLSQVINEHYGVNFNHFINEIRIQEARRIMASPEVKTYTIEAIAGRVGFRSKSVFNQSFKKFTGVTPSFYIDSLNNT